MMAARQNGFTLLELLVSISIFSILGLGAYQMLQTVMESHERVRASADSYTRVNLALTIIQRDFNQFVPRPIRDEYGEPLAPLQMDEDEYLVEFTRRGWSNPAGRVRSSLQRVAYSIDYDTEELTRHFWEVLDRAEDSEPVSQVLLTGVTDLRVSAFTDEESSLESEFSLEEADSAVPIAVEVVLSTEALGDIERVFQMVDPYAQPTGGAGNLGQENNQDGNPDINEGAPPNDNSNNEFPESPGSGGQDGP